MVLYRFTSCWPVIDLWQIYDRWVYSVTFIVKSSHWFDWTEEDCGEPTAAPSDPSSTQWIQWFSNDSAVIWPPLWLQGHDLEENLDKVSLSLLEEHKDLWLFKYFCIMGCFQTPFIWLALCQLLAPPTTCCSSSPWTTELLHRHVLVHWALEAYSAVPAPVEPLPVSDWSVRLHRPMGLKLDHPSLG